MHSIAFVVIVFIAVALALFALGAFLMTRGPEQTSRLKNMLNPSAAPDRTMKEKVQEALQPVAKLLPVSVKEANQTQKWLIQAGYREPQHARIFFGLRAALVIGPFLLVLVTGLASRAPMALIAAPAIGLILPRFLLKKKIAARVKRIRLSLPDALDLMVICVEAGLGLDQAIARVATELKNVHVDLCNEFELMGLEMRAGLPRAEALKNLTERCQVDDLRALAAVLIQTERFGTSVATALRVHSDSLRVERRQRAEEAAAKLSIKMLPALALFVFPAVMIVVIGPAVIALVRHLGPVLRGQ